MNDQELFNILKEDPPSVFPNGKKIWFNKDDEIHRDNDLPAVIWPDGSKFWWYNGERHRDTRNPAVIYADGREEWWIYDRHIK